MTRARVERFRAIARITLNGREYELFGSGTIDEDAGVVDGRYKHNIPANDLDPYVFQTVLVTGYPSVCRANGSMNPFVGADYSYRRTIDFGTYGRMSYDARCHLPLDADGRHLHSEFDVGSQPRSSWPDERLTTGRALAPVPDWRNNVVIRNCMAPV